VSSEPCLWNVREARYACITALTALSMAANEISASRNTTLLLVLFIMFFLALVLRLAHMLRAIRLSDKRAGNWTGLSTAQDHYVAISAVHGHQVPPHLLALLVLDCIRPASGRVDELRKGLGIRGRRRQTAAYSLAGAAARGRALGSFLVLLRGLAGGFLVGDGRRQRALLQTASVCRRREARVAGPLGLDLLALRQLLRLRC
jgi:hypothetical protein